MTPDEIKRLIAGVDVSINKHMDLLLFAGRLLTEIGRLRSENADLSRALRESLAHAQDLSREVRCREAERDRARDMVKRLPCGWGDPAKDEIAAALRDEEVEQ